MRSPIVTTNYCAISVMKSTAPATVSIVSFAYTGCNEGEKIPPVQEGEILEDRTKTVFLFSGFVFHK